VAMIPQFTASATTAGALLSSATFAVPPFQREYAWMDEEYEEFWRDIRNALTDDSYFLGLVILTAEEGVRAQVVDGQQRLLTITLLACALHAEATANARSALAERIRATFLYAIDYETDEMVPRVTLADDLDDHTLRSIVSHVMTGSPIDVDDGTATRMIAAFRFLQTNLHNDLATDPFRRLGLWTDFLTNRLQFAVFVHPDPASAYRVFEVINQRGRELTTADLLKNYLLSQAPAGQQRALYVRWQDVSRQLQSYGPTTFVQFIRHVVTVHAGHVLARDLFDYLAQRKAYPGAPQPPTAIQLLDMLEDALALYLQMLNPTLEGPASGQALRIFAALNDMNVITVRPLLLAVAGVDASDDGMESVLDLVVRRIVVGNLGTGNVERRFGDAAFEVQRSQQWRPALDDLRDLSPRRDEFVPAFARRSLNKAVLQFLRRSVIQGTKTPAPHGYLHLVRPRHATEWFGFEEDESYWISTIGNSILIDQQRRPFGTATWTEALEGLIPQAVEGEWVARIMDFEAWDAEAVEAIGDELAQAAAGVWY
jgi:hypothetical protein